MKLQKKLAFGLVRTKLKALHSISPALAGKEAFRLFTTPPKRSSRISEIFAHAEELSFSLNGQTVQGYRVHHPRNKKVLILHGFTSSCHSFDRYVEPLADKGYEILAFNAPAHGHSEGQTVNAVEYAAMIREVMRLYGPINALVGHSFGGLAISLAMETIPHNEETKLVLIAPATETTTAIDKAFDMLGFTNGDLLKKDMEEHILRHSGHPASWYSVNRALMNLKASILWIHDADDDITPLSDTNPTRQKNLPNLRFHISHGLGHHQVYRDPAIVKLVADFLG